MTSSYHRKLVSRPPSEQTGRARPLQLTCAGPSEEQLNQERWEALLPTGARLRFRSDSFALCALFLAGSDEAARTVQSVYTDLISHPCRIPEILPKPVQ